jgi:alanine dehydrogenase
VSHSKVQPAQFLLPQEEKLETGRNRKSLTIGIPKETSFQENRISLVPDDVKYLFSHGHEIMVETDAGKNANFQDKDYSDAGASIVYSVTEVYKADIVLKISPPTEEELELVRPGQTIVSALQLTNRCEDVIRKLMQKKATAIAFNYIKDEENVYPVVRSMSEIAGSTSILIAGEYLSNVNKGMGLVLGGISGIPPTEVVIIGAGTVGEFAARAALGLGAIVKVFDNSVHRLRRFQVDVGRRVFTSLINPSDLSDALRTADVVIGCMRAPEGRTPCVVNEMMVSNMKFGAVLIDVSIDQGGVFETSEVTDHTRPVYKKYGVTHYCVPNIASRVSHTASIALSNIMAPLFIKMGEEGGLDQLFRVDPGLRHGVYLYKGRLTNKFFADMYQIPFTDLDLLMATF